MVEYIERKERLSSYWISRVLLIRYLGFINFVAFSISWTQSNLLIGEDGLTPATLYMQRLGKNLESYENYTPIDKFHQIPTIFWFVEPKDSIIQLLNILGVTLSSYLMLTGSSNMILLFLLWIIYLSFVNIGQVWYSFGWESLLLESGFLAMFLVPMFSIEKYPHMPCPAIVIIAYRWLIFRIMIGAGLIKIRGDQCWRDLTCMNYHYQTQPVPNPLSPYFHSSPEIFHKVEVLVNHIVELILPFFIFFPRPLRILGGIAQVFFQVILISSGNLSFLNWLTILPALACFDDDCVTCLPIAMRKWIISDIDLQRIREVDSQETYDTKASSRIRGRMMTASYYARYMLHFGLVCLLAWLSVPVVMNLLSSKQMMNTSYDSYRILNTYGAFGSVTRTRYEVILQGTSDHIITGDSVWLEYDFHCKPGDIDRRPCIISPYHYRLDWHMWFAAFQSYQQCPWLVHLALKLLQGESTGNQLLAPHGNPFTKEPPIFIRAELYEYEYSHKRSLSMEASDAKTDKVIPAKSDPSVWEEGTWWRRRWDRAYMPPISIHEPSVQVFLKSHHLINEK